jgi:hypothetical protein
MRNRLVFALVASLAGACSSTALDPAVADQHLSADGTHQARIVSNLIGWPTDAMEFEQVAIRGDTLVASVRYAGGCAEHRFELVFAHLFMESDPVQMRGLLAHDARGDNCRASIGQTLRFDLTPVRDAYRAAYDVESDVVILHGNWPGSLRYEF